MNIKWLIGISIIGILLGVISVLVYSQTLPNLPPLAISYNPYETGVYAEGIIESDQLTGSDVNIFPEVAGTVVDVFAKEGETINKDTSLLVLDDTVQKFIVEKDLAQVHFQEANLVNVKDQWNKIKKAYAINNLAISKNALDNAFNAVKIAQQNVDVAVKQYLSDKALLAKFIIKAPVSGKIIRIAVTVGDYASPQGSYESYTQSFIPVIQMAIETPYLVVRSYLNEILVPKLPQEHIEAMLFIRGLTNKSIPLEYVGFQPYAQPTIQLPNTQNNRVDVRVMPILFRLAKPKDMPIYPGQLVDVYIKTLT